jgi:hypothetical protein
MPKAGTFSKERQPTKKRGRKPGVPNRITTVLKDAIVIAATEVGENRRGKDGLTGYLRWLAKNEPKSFAALLGRVLPYHIVGKLEHEHRQYVDKEEVLDALKERGLDKLVGPALFSAPPSNMKVIEHDPSEKKHKD